MQNTYSASAMGSPSRLLILMASRPLGPSLPVNPLLMLPSFMISATYLTFKSKVHHNTGQRMFLQYESNPFTCNYRS